MIDTIMSHLNLKNSLISSSTITNPSCRRIHTMVKFGINSLNAFLHTYSIIIIMHKEPLVPRYQLNSDRIREHTVTGFPGHDPNLDPHPALPRF